MEGENWSIIVLKSSKARDILINFYRFVENLQGVKDLHFLIRGREENEAVFSFRVLINANEKKQVDNKILEKLNDLMNKDKFAINPDSKHQLFKYAAWDWDLVIRERGEEKYSVLCRYLSQLSRIVVDLAEIDYFSSKERAEIAHLMCWMVGFTEAGRPISGRIKGGYLDRIEENKFYSVW